MRDVAECFVSWQIKSKSQLAAQLESTSECYSMKFDFACIGFARVKVYLSTYRRDFYSLKR